MEVVWDSGFGELGCTSFWSSEASKVEGVAFWVSYLLVKVRWGFNRAWDSALGLRFGVFRKESSLGGRLLGLLSMVNSLRILWWLVGDLEPVGLREGGSRPQFLRFCRESGTSSRPGS